MLELTGSSSELVFIPYDEVYGLGIEDMLHREPSIEKIGAAIGWQPERTLDEILADVIVAGATTLRGMSVSSRSPSGRARVRPRALRAGSSWLLPLLVLSERWSRSS